MPVWLAPAVGAALQIGSSIFQNRANRKAAERSREHDWKMMQYQLEYNKPENQMKRLAKAGINPMMAVGGGNVTGNLTGQLPKYREEPKVMNVNPEGLMGMMENYQDVQVKNKMINKIDADTRAIQIKAANDAITNDILATKNLKDAFEFKELKKLAPHQLKIKQELARKSTQDAINAVKTGELRDEEKKNKAFARSLIAAQIANVVTDTQTKRKLLADLQDGVWTNAPWFVRIAQKIGKGLGMDMSELQNSWSQPGFHIDKNYKKSQKYKGR